MSFRCLNSDLILPHAMHGEGKVLHTLPPVVLIFRVGLLAYDGESHSDSERDPKLTSKGHGKRHVRVFTFD